MQHLFSSPELRTSFLVVILLMVIRVNCCAAEYYSNVLSNAGFELGASDTVITGWSRVNNAYRKSDLKHSGNYALCTWGAFWEGNWAGSGVNQLHPVQEGEIWEASVWAAPSRSISGDNAYAALMISCYDANTQWIDSAVSPQRIHSGSVLNQWRQLKVKYIINRSVNFISASPMFIQSPDQEDGAVWFDDCTLCRVPGDYITFAGRTWLVNDAALLPPYSTYQSTNCVSVDSNGWLHLQMKQVDGVWHGAQIEAVESLGFGEYRWYMGSPLELIDSNLVAGLFIYSPEEEYGINQSEIDIEVTHAVAGSQTNCLLYTVQPYAIPGNGSQHLLDTTNDLTTQRFFWRPDRIDWQTYYGHTATPSPEQFLAGWRFDRRGIPIETNERTIMNLWLLLTNAPASGQGLEMVIRDFVFVPFDGFILLDDFDDDAISNAWTCAGIQADVIETGEHLVITPSSASTPSGYQTAEYIHRNERGTKYVFSARLSDLTVITPQAGDDLVAWLSFSTGTNQTPIESPGAIILAGRFDSETDRLTFELTMKTNAPNSLGALRYAGVLSNANSRLSAGGLDIRLELDPGSYHFCVQNPQGNEVEIAAVCGSAAGQHQLGEAVNNGFWLVGAQRANKSAVGSVSWDRTVIGVTGQVDSFKVKPSVSSDGQPQFTLPGFFDSRCSVYRTTNLTEAFVPVATDIPVTAPNMTLSNAVEDSARAYYRIKQE